MRIIETAANGVAIEATYFVGYGSSSPPCWEFRVIYQNKVLKKESLGCSDFHAGVVCSGLLRTWSVFTKDDLKDQAAAVTETAYTICDRCQGECRDGTTYVGETHFCKVCAKEFEPYHDIALALSGMGRYIERVANGQCGECGAQLIECSSPFRPATSHEFLCPLRPQAPEPELLIWGRRT